MDLEVSWDFSGSISHLYSTCRKLPTQILTELKRIGQVKKLCPSKQRFLLKQGKYKWFNHHCWEDFYASKCIMFMASKYCYKLIILLILPTFWWELNKKFVSHLTLPHSCCSLWSHSWNSNLMFHIRPQILLPWNIFILAVDFKNWCS